MKNVGLKSKLLFLGVKCKKVITTFEKIFFCNSKEIQRRSLSNIDNHGANADKGRQDVRQLCFDFFFLGQAS